jgi:hypothetical protein
MEPPERNRTRSNATTTISVAASTMRRAARHSLYSSTGIGVALPSPPVERAARSLVNARITSDQLEGWRTSLLGVYDVLTRAQIARDMGESLEEAAQGVRKHRANHGFPAAADDTKSGS